jgi:zinc finger/BTB domain-containing protein 40
LEAILRHSKLLREAIQQTAGCERLSSEEEHLAETVQEVGSEDRWRFVGHGVV